MCCSLGLWWGEATGGPAHTAVCRYKDKDWMESIDFNAGGRSCLDVLINMSGIVNLSVT